MVTKMHKNMNRLHTHTHTHTHTQRSSINIEKEKIGATLPVMIYKLILG